MNGTLLIAGGNIGATEQGKADIFGRFSALCGGKRGKVMLAVCASGEAEESFRFNRELLLSAGIGEVVLLPLTEDPALLGRSGWTNHADEALLPLFDGVSGVWFSGGDQLHTTRLLLQPDGSDTPVLGRMRRLLSDGGVIGGSSAGAAIMSRTMIVRGDDEGTLTLPVCTDAAAYCDNGGVSPEQLLLSHGLGFLPGGIVDQHFNRRARLQRLLAAMEDADSLRHAPYAQRRDDHHQKVDCGAARRTIKLKSGGNQHENQQTSLYSYGTCSCGRTHPHRLRQSVGWRQQGRRL